MSGSKFISIYEDRAAVFLKSPLRFSPGGFSLGAALSVGKVDTLLGPDLGLSTAWSHVTWALLAEHRRGLSSYLKDFKLGHNYK